MVNMSKANEFAPGEEKIFEESSLNFELHAFGGKQQHTGKSDMNLKRNQKEGSISQKLVCMLMIMPTVFHLSDCTRSCEMTFLAENVESEHFTTPYCLKQEALACHSICLLSTKPGIIMDQYQDSKIHYSISFQLLFSSRAHCGLIS